MTGLEAQTPSGDQIFLDHVGWFVPDMDAAAADFERLGFPMTPLTVHENERPDGSRGPSGSANRCAMIARGYLEVLVRMPGVDSPLARQMEDALSRYAGLHLIAFTVADAGVAVRRLRDAGFDPAPPVALRRKMPLDGGGDATAAFSVIRLPAGRMAEGRVQMLTQDTPDVVWQPSAIARENALDMLSGALVCSPDPAEAAARYARFTGRPTIRDGRRHRLALDRGEILFCDAEACRAILPGVSPPSMPFIAAVSIRSAELDATRSFLAGRGIPLLANQPARVVVRPCAGAGAAFVLHAGGADPFPAS